MSQQQLLGLIGVSLTATATLATKQYYAVIADTTDADACLIAGANARVLGWLQNKPAAGEVATVFGVRGATTKAVAGAAITKGDALITDSAGKVITAAGAAQKICGVALEAATADGDVIEIFILDGYVA